jgi:transcriptional regulator with PAS, ATPase and Fis domain
MGNVLLLLEQRVPFKGSAKSGPLVGVSAAHAELLAQIARVAPSDATVLIVGETGVGKELVAGEIHRLSGVGGRLSALNCGALAEGVVHSELFGHTRGAFSGAGRERAGLVASAAGGSLFLDEIGDASPTLQASLLRLLEQREYRAVGSDQTLRTDARFIAATHVPLEPAVAAGRFRGDLYARLARALIHVLPLRTRREDVVPLALHFAQHLMDAPRLRRSLARALLRYDWPGNVRELHSVVEQLCREAADREVLALTPTVAARLRSGSTPSSASPARAAGERAHKPTSEVLEQRFLALQGNLRALSIELGVSRNTLYRWIDEQGIDLVALRDKLRS